MNARTVIVCVLNPNARVCGISEVISISCYLFAWTREPQHPCAVGVGGLGATMQRRSSTIGCWFRRCEHKHFLHLAHVYSEGSVNTNCAKKLCVCHAEFNDGLYMSVCVNYVIYTSPIVPPAGYICNAGETSTCTCTSKVSVWIHTERIVGAQHNYTTLCSAMGWDVRGVKWGGRQQIFNSTRVQETSIAKHVRIHSTRCSIHTRIEQHKTHTDATHV